MARAPKNKKLPRKKAGRKSAGQGSAPAGGPRQDGTLRPLERLLFEAAGNFSGDYILLTSTAGAQAAAEVARRNPNAEVTCNYFDVFLAQAAKKRWEDVENLGVTCLADLPEGPIKKISVEHPLGEVSVVAEVSVEDGALQFHQAAIVRTARKLFEGKVFI